MFNTRFVFLLFTVLAICSSATNIQIETLNDVRFSHLHQIPLFLKLKSIQDIFITLLPQGFLLTFLFCSRHLCSTSLSGSLSDPSNIAGLAHFCEHMLFLGTKKYPKENEYSQFLSEHAGSSNAFTSGEHTNYYFDVSHEHLQGALDR